MARTSMVGWETQSVADHPNQGLNLGSVSWMTGNATYDTTIVRTGTTSLRVAPTSGTAGSCAAAIFGGFRRVYVRITSLPATSRELLGSNSGVNVLLNADGTLTFRTGNTSTGTTTTALTDSSRWYCVEWRAATTTGATVDLLRIDGTVEVSADPATASAQTGLGSSTSVGDPYVAYFDDLVTDNTDWPGEGKVVLLLPTAQNSVTASTWQKPGGATTNMHTSVDNVPPIGVAASTNSAQAENQIRQAVSNATADVVFAMTTYTAAGIGASDTINAVQAFAITGSATTAVTKTGSLETTNPAQAEANFGAFGTGAAQGTFPTNWQRRNHTITQTPSVTVGTAPTVEVGTRVANTTAAGVCFVGMYVDYTPGVAPAAKPPYRNPMPPLIAQ